ncbi:MAG: cytochrome d ubiquinol oxidase subunit II, partial [Pirellulaceae bacterium]
DDDKRLLYHAIGPVWEANHVWLIFVLMVLWNGFPQGFAAICRLATVPLALALTGIVFRGAAYAFRSSLSAIPEQKRRWEGVFALASTAAPFFFGCTIGVLAGRQTSLDASGQFQGNWLTGWISVESLFFGFFAVGICSFIASVFLVREAAAGDNHDLEQRWRRRALAMGWLVGAFSVAGLGVAAWRLDFVWNGVVNRAWPAVALAMLCGITTIVAIHKRKYWQASITAALTITLVLAGWAWAQYPYLVIDSISIHESQTPPNVMWMMIGVIVIGLIIVIPPLVWLFYIFKSQTPE